MWTETQASGLTEALTSVGWEKEPPPEMCQVNHRLPGRGGGNGEPPFIPRPAVTGTVLDCLQEASDFLPTTG